MRPAGHASHPLQISLTRPEPTCPSTQADKGAELVIG